MKETYRMAQNNMVQPGIGRLYEERKEFSSNQKVTTVGRKKIKPSPISSCPPVYLSDTPLPSLHLAHIS
jgi:hypothetical protein